MLLNNAGIIGLIPILDHVDKQHFGTINYDVWDIAIRTNTFAPIKMAEAFVENVAASEQKKDHRPVEHGRLFPGESDSRLLLLHLKDSRRQSSTTLGRGFCGIRAS